MIRIKSQVNLNLYRKDDGWYIGLNENDRGLKFKGEATRCVDDVTEFFSWNYRKQSDVGSEMEAYEGITCL